MSLTHLLGFVHMYSIKKFYEKLWDKEDREEQWFGCKLGLFLLRMCNSKRMYCTRLQYAKQVPPNGSYHNFVTNF